MKRTLLIALIFISLKSYSQSKLPQSAINEYANQVYYHSNYGTDAFKAFFYRGMMVQGYHEKYKIDMGIENLISDYKFREASFKAWYQLTGSNKNLLYENLKSIGISASSANALVNYIISKRELEIIKQKELERKQDIISEKEQIIEQQKQEIIRKKQEAARREKERTLQSKIYDLSAFDHSEYVKYKDLLISDLKLYIKNKPIESNLKVHDTYKYIFSNREFNVSEFTENISSVNNQNPLLFSSFKIKAVPNKQIDDVQVPVKFEVSDINLDFVEGITTLKIKGNEKVKFLNDEMDDMSKKTLLENLHTFRKGTYKVTYRFGKINDDSLNQLEQILTKKPNNYSWLIYPLLIGGIIGANQLGIL